MKVKAIQSPKRDDNARKKLKTCRILFKTKQR